MENKNNTELSATVQMCVMFLGMLVTMVLFVSGTIWEFYDRDRDVDELRGRIELLDSRITRMEGLQDK